MFFFYGVVLFLVNLISNQLARFPRNARMECVGPCQAALIIRVYELLWFKKAISEIM